MIVRPHPNVEGFVVQREQTTGQVEYWAGGWRPWDRRITKAVIFAEERGARLLIKVIGAITNP